MGTRRIDVLINEKEVRELLDIIRTLFGIRAGYFYHTAEGGWRAVMNMTGFYCDYCLIARRKFAERCERSNDDFLIKAKELMAPLWYQCYNGLYEMYLPLVIDGHEAGFLHLGQVRTEKDFDAVIRECGLLEHPDLNELRARYLAMPVMEKGKLDMISKLVTVFAEKIVRNRLVDLTDADPAYFLERYIETYACSGASIAGAARFIGKSPSYVTHMFRSLHKKPFREYLTDVRVAKAKEFLLSDTIEKAAKRTGFKNRYHFTRVFTKAAGCSPAAYQKRARTKGRDPAVKAP